MQKETAGEMVKNDIEKDTIKFTVGDLVVNEKFVSCLKMLGDMKPTNFKVFLSLNDLLKKIENLQTKYFEAEKAIQKTLTESLGVKEGEEIKLSDIPSDVKEEFFRSRNDALMEVVDTGIEKIDANIKEDVTLYGVSITPNFYRLMSIIFNYVE